jgi:hypothetical protein
VAIAKVNPWLVLVSVQLRPLLSLSQRRLPARRALPYSRVVSAEPARVSPAQVKPALSPASRYRPFPHASRQLAAFGGGDQSLRVMSQRIDVRLRVHVMFFDGVWNVASSTSRTTIDGSSGAADGSPRPTRATGVEADGFGFAPGPPQPVTMAQIKAPTRADVAESRNDIMVSGSLGATGKTGAGA